MADFTPQEQLVIDKAKILMPTGFILDTATGTMISDEKILLYAELIVNDMNVYPPQTNYTVNSMPNRWIGTTLIGMSYYAQLFKQMEVTLQDFTYNDNGLTVSIDQTAKINTSIVNVMKAYAQQVEFIKKSLLMTFGSGLGTPRFQSQIGQFLKIALGSSYAWGSTSSQ